MNLYKTTILNSGDNDDGDKISWQGTQAEASAVRAAATAAGAKRANVTTEDVNVPTDKPGLLAFLNANCVGN